jgi:type IV pilus assembly protein PilY1
MKNHSSLRARAGRFTGRLLSVGLMVLALGVLSTPSMAAVTVDQQPLIIQKSLPPNIVLMFDDSGSMAWDFMPDAKFLPGATTNNGVTLVDLDALRYSGNNGTYYNPGVTYTPPVKADGTKYTTPTGIDSAFVDGFRSATTTDVTQYASDSFCDYNNVSSRNCTSGNSTSYHYFKYYSVITTTSNNTSTYAATPTCSGSDTLVKDGSANNGLCKRTSGGNTTYRNPSTTGCTSPDTYLPASLLCQKITQVTTNTNLFTYTVPGSNGTYTRKYIGKTGACTAASLTSATCDDSTTAQQNVANWFSYFRTRILMAKSGLMNSFSGLDTTFRVGFGSIDGNNDSKLPTGQTSKNNFNIANVKPFVDQKTAFWTWLEGETANNGTPLRSALDAVGQYYKTDQPWGSMSSDPDYGTASGNTELACRQSYTILTTDGFWNGAAASATIGDADSTAKTNSGGNSQSYTFTAAKPYRDGVSNTLADVAMYYWVNDLRTNTSNEVPVNNEDPAFWQHMTTFTLGLGFTPTGITPAGTTVDQIFTWARGGTAINGFAWPATSSDSINNIADLAHAAVNGHGGFYSATSPEAFTSGLKDALKRATERVGTGASLAANSTQLKTGTVAYQANYYTAKWKGDLKALSINANSGAIATNPDWTAAAALPAYADRKVYSYNASAVSPNTPVFQFNAANVGMLSGTQQAALGATSAAQQILINYLLGDTSQEQRNGGTLRNRDTPLGDIVNSQPVYVGAPNANQFVGKSFTGSSTFASYAAGKASQAGRILVAANDGMLHAFNGSTGAEVYAYLPSAVITSNLKQIADPGYGGTDVAHQYFNDGELTVADVYYGSPGAWHTVAVGTTGRGLAKAVYALDVTDPDVFKLLWERSASDGLTNSSYIGQMNGKPVVAQTANGSWSVLIGNGYNSSNGTAALLQFGITDGALTVHTTSDPATGNGLAAPGVWIGNAANGISTVAYAGDAKGQVWKFGLNDGTAATPSSIGTLVFTATDAGGTAQPITAGMLMGRDPATSNLWLFFGTGKYLASGDLNSTATQTWYGLIVQASTDTVVTNLVSQGRTALVQRQILAESAGDSAATPPVSPGRAITAKPSTSDMGDKSGWYMDLTSPSNGAEGERIVTPNQFQGSLLLGTTRIPQATDACNPSGRGWIMALDPFSGAAASTSFFDLNGNGAINDADGVRSGNNTLTNSGIGFNSLPNNPIFVGGVMLVSFDNGSNGSVYTAGSQGDFSRVSWRELVNP